MNEPIANEEASDLVPNSSDNSKHESTARLIALHDQSSADLSHIQAKAWKLQSASEEFGLFDYVRIEQGGRVWIGQITQPNQNISIVGDRFDPTILHGLELMQSHPNVQSVESVQVYDILILGIYENDQLITPRVRPFPGASIRKLDAKDTTSVIGLPPINKTGTNVIGELL